MLTSADCSAPRVSAESDRRLASSASNRARPSLVSWVTRDWATSRPTVSASAAAAARSRAVLADGEGAGWPATTRWRPELAEQADLGAVVDVLDGDA